MTIGPMPEERFRCTVEDERAALGVVVERNTGHSPRRCGVGSVVESEEHTMSQVSP